MNLNLATKHRTILDIVCNDLKNALQSYKDRKVGVRLLSKKMELSERTLQRILSAQNRPTAQTLLKIYKVLSPSQSYESFLNHLPEIIAKEISSHYPMASKAPFIDSHFKDFQNELLYDKCFHEIYVLAACGVVSHEFIQYRFGAYGIETLEKMLELQALKRTKEGQYTIGENQPDLNAHTLKQIGLNLTEKYAEPHETETGGHNLIAFFAEGLSNEAYDQWLQIDERAFKEKVSLVNQTGAKGTNKAFTFMVTDTLTLNKSKNNLKEE